MTHLSRITLPAAIQNRLDMLAIVDAKIKAAGRSYDDATHEQKEAWLRVLVLLNEWRERLLPKSS